jgi:hypothetical protein
MVEGYLGEGRGTAVWRGRWRIWLKIKLMGGVSCGVVGGDLVRINYVFEEDLRIYSIDLLYDSIDLVIDSIDLVI